MLSTVATKLKNPVEEAFVMKAIRFYMNPDPPAPGESFGGDLRYVTGVALESVYNAIESDAVTNFVDAVNSPKVTAAMTVVLRPETVQGVQNITGLIQPMGTTSELN